MINRCCVIHCLHWVGNDGPVLKHGLETTVSEVFIEGHIVVGVVRHDRNIVNRGHCLNSCLHLQVVEYGWLLVVAVNVRVDYNGRVRASGCKAVDFKVFLVSTVRITPSVDLVAEGILFEMESGTIQEGDNLFSIGVVLVVKDIRVD